MFQTACIVLITIQLLYNTGQNNCNPDKKHKTLATVPRLLSALDSVNLLSKKICHSFWQRKVSTYGGSYNPNRKTTKIYLNSARTSVRYELYPEPEKVLSHTLVVLKKTISVNCLHLLFLRVSWSMRRGKSRSVNVIERFIF